ncbi:MATE family efflux transporter [Phreatobacter aquaticus]|uniref:MATE family efflux transporter n=2 Tax=Phreatobacter aquaticus TaxID=2570229 RepID=A0A4D7QN23_9HYPH|nr:MATE family efflux transporter [Phreatobacter aquaticus]
MRHVVEMTVTGSIGLVSIFFVDLLNLFYIAQLGEQELAAAIGYAGTVLFFLTSFGIGLSIAGTALVSRALGAGDRHRARQLATSSLVLVAIAMTAISLGMLPVSGWLLTTLGAAGRTHAIADRFLWMVMPATVFLGLGMMYSSILRAAGDAKRAMWVTLAGGIVTAIADPILIFGFGLGVDGAAIASVISRLAMLALGWHSVVRVHKLTSRATPAHVISDLKPLARIAVPAILTNLATPLGNSIVTAMIARYGDGAVAGWAVLGRLVPVAFGAFFALSGSVGPIMGQNVGARLFPRVRQTLTDSLTFIALYGLAVWLILFALSGPIVHLFGATGEAAAVIRFFCVYAALAWAFNGAVFVANAAFNNLGFATYSTVFNWARATIGTVPFAMAGAWIAGPAHGAEGIIAGQAVGGIVFGIASILICYRVIDRLGQRPPDEPPMPAGPPSANSPFTSGKAATAGA